MNELYRCYHCKAIHFIAAITDNGKCKKCGSRKFTEASHLEDDEVEVIKAQGYEWKPEEWNHYA